MTRRLACAALTIGLFATAAPAWAQSLGDVARKEQARRATAKKAVKSFSNADLNPQDIKDPAAEAAAVPAQAAPDQAAKTPSAADTPATDAKPAATPKDAAPVAQQESVWRRNADALRKEIETEQAEHSRLELAANDASKLPGERAQATRLAAQQQKALERVEQRWLRFEKQAESLGVPREWLAPRPMLSLRIPQ